MLCCCYLLNFNWVKRILRAKTMMAAPFTCRISIACMLLVGISKCALSTDPWWRLWDRVLVMREGDSTIIPTAKSWWRLCWCCVVVRNCVVVMRERDSTIICLILMASNAKSMQIQWASATTTIGVNPLIYDIISLTLNPIYRRSLLSYYRKKRKKGAGGEGKCLNTWCSCYFVLPFVSLYPFHFVRLTASLPLQALCMPWAATWPQRRNVWHMRNEHVNALGGAWHAPWLPQTGCSGQAWPGRARPDLTSDSSRKPLRFGPRLFMAAQSDDNIDNGQL